MKKRLRATHFAYGSILAFIGLALLAARPLAPRPDYAGLYYAGPRLETDTRREADSLRIYLRLPDATRLGPGRPLRLTAWPTFDARQALWQDSVPRRQQHRHPAGRGEALVSFCVAAAQVPAGTVLQIQTGPVTSAEALQAASTTAWLRLTSEHLSRTFVLTDSAGQPLLRRYVRTTEIFGVESFGLYQPVRWQRYNLQPQPALPPMTDPATAPGGPRLLTVLDSATAAPGQQLRFGLPGLYTVKVGGTGGVLPRTVAVLAEDAQYPNLGTATELIEPLRYLTTGKERQTLTDAPDPKRAVDKFWLGIARGNQQQARELIRRYYGRASTANQLFAAHKAGWMTDQGLLYTVLGPPESVRRYANNEERWIYSEVGTEGEPVVFAFRPKPSTFAPNYYELVRRPSYEQLWYAAVEQWRTGTNAPSVPTDPRGR